MLGGYGALGGGVVPARCTQTEGAAGAVHGIVAGWGRAALLGLGGPVGRGREGGELWRAVGTVEGGGGGGRGDRVKELGDGGTLVRAVVEAVHDGSSEAPRGGEEERGPRKENGRARREEVVGCKEML